MFADAAAELRRLYAENKRLAALVEAQQPAPSVEWQCGQQASGFSQQPAQSAAAAVVVYEQKENEMQVWFRPARMHGHPERTPIKATITKDRGNGIVDLTYDDGEFSGNARAVPNALRLPRNVREQVAVWWDVGFEMDFQTAVDNSHKKKKDDPTPQPSPTPQADSAPTSGNWVSADDVNRLVRELDVALNGEAGAAVQASLCDVVAQVRLESSKRGQPLLAPQADSQPAQHQPDVEGEHARLAIAIYSAATGGTESEYCRLSTSESLRWERAALAAREVCRDGVLFKIQEVVACAGKDWPDMPGEPEVLRRVKALARLAVRQTESQPAPVRDYPPLPEPDLGMPWRVNAKSDGAAHSSGFTYEQMRAYVDADRAARAPAESESFERRLQAIATDRDFWREQAQKADSVTAPAYSIDADPQGIRARVAEAITGALAFGAQGANPPPPGHWLAPFWESARWDAIRAKPVHPSADTLYLLRRLLSNQHTLTGSEFRAELVKIVEAAHAITPPAQAADSVLEDAARWQELRAQHEDDAAERCCVFAPNDMRECLVPVGSLPGELDAFIDAKIAARKQGGA